MFLSVTLVFQEVERFKAGQKLEFLDPLDKYFNKLKVGTVVRVMKVSIR